ncbi:MAG: pentapeptide repeat-containing protein [Armatimonadota bacterium]
MAIKGQHPKRISVINKPDHNTSSTPNDTPESEPPQPIVENREHDQTLTKQQMVDMLMRSVDEWNEWRMLNTSVELDLSGANLEGACLQGAKFGDMNTVEARTIGSGPLWMYAFWLSDSFNDNPNIIVRAKNIIAAYRLLKKESFGVDQNINLEPKPNNEVKVPCDAIPVNLKGANLKGANLTRAILDGAILDHADLDGAILANAHIVGTSFIGANLSNTNVDGLVYLGFLMGGKYRGVRVDGCYGNALFKRDAQDQDYIDSLWAKQRDILSYSILGTYILERDAVFAVIWHHYLAHIRMFLYRLWMVTTNYGRSIELLSVWTLSLISLFGRLYQTHPSWVDYGLQEPMNKTGVGWSSGPSTFSPYYYSIVIFTTLGFGDVHPVGTQGQIAVACEVLLGYVTLGLLLSILGNKVARRS